MNFKFFLLSVLLFPIFLVAQNNNGLVPINNTSSKLDIGFISYYYDQNTDKITLEIEKLDYEFLYLNGLATGLGSNDIGLDRGKLGEQKVVKFVKAGNKLLLTQVNYMYRAESENQDEIKAVNESFAESVIFGFKIEKIEGGKYYIDATDFFIRDAFDVSGVLKRSKEGQYKLDKSRSAFYLPKTKNFPKNSEFEVTLTFTGNPTGQYVYSVSPDPKSITLRQHHSFIQLPEKGFKPREFDPRAGYFNISYFDYATPISQPLTKRFIQRHRLKKKDPSAAVSEAVEPIVYYLDRGTPEPVRSALMDGAKWWNQAYEAAGYKDAFQVKIMPEGADPMDVRYNLIQWVHRSTRGWSYGNTVYDPRTGEIIKGHVSLGSLRVRQDYLIAEGLLAPYENGNEVPKEVQDMALARLRQLSAHEVGHTLGLAHSYASSTEGKASVMDYPHPTAEIKDGKIVLTNAYDNKIGAFDKVSITYGYQDFPEGTNEKEALENIILGGIKNGLTFLSDNDARPRGGAHPYAHLWDNGKKPVEELDRIMEVRALALNNFGEKNIKKGQPFATLEELIVPIYFFHRYQVEATSKIIGGLDYRFAARGDGQMVTAMVDPSEQTKALIALMNVLNPESLALPEKVLKVIPPRAMGYYRNRELVNIRTGITFDALGLAETTANMIYSLVLHPSRAGRLVEYNSRDNNQPGLERILDMLIANTWKSDLGNDYKAELQRTVDNNLLSNLIKLATHEQASSEVKSIVYFKINVLKEELKKKVKKENSNRQKAHFSYAVSQISVFQNNPEEYKMPKALTPPAGSPIGMDSFCGH